ERGKRSNQIFRSLDATPFLHPRFCRRSTSKLTSLFFAFPLFVAMAEKFEFYDVLGILVPGSMLLGLIAVSFPDVASAFASVGFPNAFAVICLIVVAVFLGQLVQAISSLLEPIFNWTWSGRPSERALQEVLG